MFDNKNLKPMLLKEVSKPFNNNDYLYELKFDGYRVIVYVSNTSLVIKSRNGHDITYKYPELQVLQKIVENKKVIFDGELVIMNNSIPSFRELQKRGQLTNKAKIKEASLNNPVTFVAFDILYQNKDLTNLPLLKRKEILAKYPDNNIFIKSKVFSDGEKLFKVVKDFGFEGIVAKLKNSPYIPGKRVDFWLKIKNFKIEKFYVHGIITNAYKYSLLLGEYHNNKFYYVGKVSIMKNSNLASELQKIPKSNNLFQNYDKEGEFIKPIIKVKVNYLERTENNILRQPTIFK